MSALRLVSKHLYSWSRIHGIAPRTYRWNSHVVRLGDEGRLALIDPLPLDLPEQAAIEGLGRPELVLLTSAYHERGAAEARARWGCKVLIQDLGTTEVDKPVDGSFHDGDRFGQRLLALRLPGVSHVEETAFLLESEEPALIVGDALCGARADLGIADGEVGVFSTTRFAGRGEAINVYARLLDRPWDVIAFGHGEPVLHGGHAALSRLLDRLRAAPAS